MQHAVQQAVRQVVILGGGSAGWLTAATLAAELGGSAPDALRITLIEAPDIGSIGVGEGTWPSMRGTLHRAGLDENRLLRDCDAAFKQGSAFAGWVDGSAADRYLHPFTLPHGTGDVDPVRAWQASAPDQPFADVACAPAAACWAGLAPKQAQTPAYGGVCNYGYHFDAVKLGRLLREHATQALGVRHLADEVLAVRTHDNGDIAALTTAAHGDVTGDLFIDCSGLASRLLGQHYGIGCHSLRPVLFNDRALAVQVAYADPAAPIASATLATAHAEGWTWDIGLPTRRGVGLVYSSAHCSDDAAEARLHAHLQATGSGAPLAAPRCIRFEPGYRQTFWHRNCVAVGLAAGFIEPLEASALALVELSAATLRDEWPATRADMDLVARRFNEDFHYRWQRIVDFLKLHYALSRRDDSDYWRAHRQPASQPESLRERLQLWRHRAPSRSDLPRHDEVFPVASYQYVLYGMGFAPARGRPPPDAWVAQARAWRDEAQRHSRRLLGALPRHRDLIQHLHAHGPSRP